MANRPVFVSKTIAPFFDEVNIEFKYYNGFSLSQNRKSINSLHERFNDLYPDRRVLEISSKSENELGIKLSAFNLALTDELYGTTTVECAYQGGKIFEYGGPYLDLLSKTSKEAKKDLRLSQSGSVIGFSMNGRTYIQKDIEVFYSYLYISALRQNTKLAEAIMNYDSFTDIVFSPKKGISCQARSAAMFVGMKKAGAYEAYTDSFIMMDNRSESQQR